MFFKIKAGALQLTTFIVVVIGLLLAAFIILVYTQKTFKVQTAFTIDTIKNANTGIHYILNNDIIQNDTIAINLHDEDYKSLKVHRNFWGIFEKATSISTIKNKTYKKSALIGAKQNDINRTALYLEDNNRPLVVVGNTKIQGLVYLPKQGVRTGNISGHSYYGKTLIYGPTKTSNKLPKLNKSVLQQIKNVVKKTSIVNQDQFLDLSEKRIFKNSFYKPLQIVYSTQSINLSSITLIGHILIQSESKIIIDASSNLKDVVLVAPIIEVKNNVEGIFQCFATKDITVGSNCKLNYPSALVLNEKAIQTTQNTTSNIKETSFIKVNKNTIIKGNITYLGDTKNYNPQVFIDEKTNIIGEVYCNRNLELLGTVSGSVYTSGFVAKQSGSVYQNHIYNGTINTDYLALEYSGLSFSNSKKSVAKWLY